VTQQASGGGMGDINHIGQGWEIEPCFRQHNSNWPQDVATP
jgi:hypothetical protein